MTKPIGLALSVSDDRPKLCALSIAATFAAVTISGCTLRDADDASRTTGPELAGEWPIQSAPALGLWSHRFRADANGGALAIAFSRAPVGVAIVRYLPSGRVDPFFKRRVHRGLAAGALDAIAAVLDRRSGATFIVACPRPDCDRALVVRRVNRDGTLDQDFASRARRIDTGNVTVSPRGIAVDQDGRILVVAAAQEGTARSLFAARLRPDGTLDPNFGDGGTFIDRRVATFADGRIAQPGAVAVDQEGHLVVAGSGFVSRYDESGEPDASFGRDGLARVPYLLVARDVLITDDGRILVGGSGGDGRRPALALVRVTAAGSLDATFASDGVLLDRRPGDHWGRIEDLIAVENGRVLAGGWVTRGRAAQTRTYTMIVLTVDDHGLQARFASGGRAMFEAREGRTSLLLHEESQVVAVGPDDDLRPESILFARVPG